MKHVGTNVVRLIVLAAAFIWVQCAWIFGLDEPQRRARPEDVADGGGARFIVDPPEIEVLPGQRVDVKVSIDREVVRGTVTFRVRGELPSNVTIAGESATLEPNDPSTTFTLFANGSARPGDSARLTIEAESSPTSLAPSDLPLEVRGIPGSIDRTFAQNGIAYLPNRRPDAGGNEVFSAARDVLVFEDGSIAASGHASGFASRLLLGPEPGRLHAVTTFHDAGATPVGLIEGAIIPVEPNGLAGQAFGSDPSFNGYLDALWSNPTKAAFLVAGNKLAGASGCPIKRFLMNGRTEDPSFDRAGCADKLGAYQAARMALQPDGKIVAGLNLGGGQGGVARLSRDGTPDRSFAGTKAFATLVSPTGVALSLSGVVLEPSGKIVAALRGEDFAFTLDEPRDEAPTLFRLMPDGTPDTTFQTRFDEPHLQIARIALQAKGRRLIAAGSMRKTTAYDKHVFAVARYWL